MISERISDDIPPQMKILNMVIPILMRFYKLVSNWSVAGRIKAHKGVRHPTKCGVINDIKLFPTVYRRIYCLKFLTLSNQTSRCKLKCIRIPDWITSTFAAVAVYSWPWGHKTFFMINSTEHKIYPAHKC